MSENQRPWVTRMMDFAAYMREHGHRYTFMHCRQGVRPIGAVGTRVPTSHANDNRAQRAKP